VARVKLSFDAWAPGKVTPAIVEVPVVVPKVKLSPELAATLTGHDEGLWKVAISADGKTLAALSGTRGVVKLWDLPTRTARATLTSDLGSSYGMAFTPDDATLAVGHCIFDEQQQRVTNGGIELWDVASGKRITVLQRDPPSGVTSLAVSPDGKTLAATETIIGKAPADSRRVICFWGLEARKPGTEIPFASIFAFSPDGMTVAHSRMIMNDGKYGGDEIAFWDMRSGRDTSTVRSDDPKSGIARLAYSPDGRSIVAAHGNGSITVWDAATRTVRLAVSLDDRRQINAITFSPDSRTLAAVAGNRLGRYHEPGRILLWETSTGRHISTLTGHTSDVQSLAFTPDGKTLASGGADRTVRLWDVSRLSKAQTK
jgi:WD40 repeat protein